MAVTVSGAIDPKLLAQDLAKVVLMILKEGKQ